MKISSATASLSNAAFIGVARKAMELVLGIDAQRDLPAFERATFRERASSRDSCIEDPVRRVALDPDMYRNYVRTERGKTTVCILEVGVSDVDRSDVRRYHRE